MENKNTRQEFVFFSSRRRHTRLQGDWSSDVCSSDLARVTDQRERRHPLEHGPALQPGGAAERPPVVPQLRGAQPEAPETGADRPGEMGAAEIGRASCRERVQKVGQDAAVTETTTRK